MIHIEENCFFSSECRTNEMAEKCAVGRRSGDEELHPVELFSIDLRRAFFDLRRDSQLIVTFQISMLWQFIKRHRRKLFLLSLLAGGRSSLSFAS